MVAAIDSMMFKGETPWHGLGNRIEDSKKLSVSEAIDAAGMGWDVSLSKLVTADKSDPVPAQAVYRVVDGERVILGVVGPRWTPLQNSKAFEFFQPWLDNGLAEFHTAGALFKGEKVWVLAKLALDNIEVAKGDEITPYVLLSNSHDGKNAVRVGFTPIRVVCYNTLCMAHNDEASKLIRVRHTSKVETNLEKLRDTMNLIKQEFEATAEQYRVLTRKQFNQDDIKKYVKVLLGVDNVKDDELPTRTTNIMTGIMDMVVNGKGQDNPVIKGTWWAAYNGYNEYLNYVQGRNAENRIDALWFGQNYGKNRDALKLALQLAG
jgi:phage/plasmid-like protein (TIGR03299 family)